MDVIGYDKTGFIVAILEDQEISIPDAMDNCHRQMIAEWEAVGNTIPPYTPSPEEQRKIDFPNLEPDQFWFIVRASGYESDLMAWLESMRETGPVAWAAASAKLDFAKYFERDHPFIEEARVAIGMTTQELDALWRYA